MAWLHQNSVFAPVLALCQESSPERLGKRLISLGALRRAGTSEIVA